MPDFAQENIGYKALVIHFLSAEDMDAFARLVGQTVGPKTRSIWYPEQKYMEAGSQRFVVDEP